MIYYVHNECQTLNQSNNDEIKLVFIVFTHYHLIFHENVSCHSIKGHTMRSAKHAKYQENNMPPIVEYTCI